MKLFISFASEQARVAEEIYRKLLAAGYDAFYSSDDIRAAEGYDERIRDELARVDRVIFLASADSLRPGRYTLTELRMISDRWPDPTGRVMTVMIGDVSYGDVPPYLGAVTSAVTPHGNVASEVAAVVARTWPLAAASDHRSTFGFGAVLLAALLALGGWMVFSGRDSSPLMAALPPPPQPLDPAFLDTLRDDIRTGRWGRVYDALAPDLAVGAVACLRQLEPDLVHPDMPHREAYVGAMTALAERDDGANLGALLAGKQQTPALSFVALMRQPGEPQVEPLLRTGATVPYGVAFAEAGYQLWVGFRDASWRIVKIVHQW